MIETVIIDAQKQDRDRAASLLSVQNDIEILAYGKDGYDALNLIGRLKPDIAILNNHLDFIEGEEIPPLLKERSPSTAIILAIRMISDHQLSGAVSNKVLGFVSKETDMDTLPMIVKHVSAGGCFISPALAARFLRLLSAKNAATKKPGTLASGRDHFERPDIHFGGDPVDYLSKTELRILAFIGEGCGSNEIAKNLDLTVGTVRNNISTIMRKTGLRNRSQIARYAFRYGLVY
jgi:DNA-binding NarL/FixJ family response regulator